MSGTNGVTVFLTIEEIAKMQQDGTIRAFYQKHFGNGEVRIHGFRSRADGTAEVVDLVREFGQKKSGD